MGQVLDLNCLFQLVSISTWMSKASQTHAGTGILLAPPHPRLPLVQPVTAQLMATAFFLKAFLVAIVLLPPINQRISPVLIYIQNTFRIWPFLSACAITTMTWAAIIFCLNWCKTLLTGLPTSLTSKQLILSKTARESFWWKLVRHCWLLFPLG